jgi:hypothetical protein
MIIMHICWPSSNPVIWLVRELRACNIYWLMVDCIRAATNVAAGKTAYGAAHYSIYAPKGVTDGVRYGLAGTFLNMCCTLSLFAG